MERAPSWTATTSTPLGKAAKPLRTEPIRVGPAATTVTFPPESLAPCSLKESSPRTRMTLSTSAIDTKHFNDNSATVEPASGRNCFGRPMREPEPPETMIAAARI